MRTIPVSAERCCDWKNTASFSPQLGHSLFARGSYVESVLAMKIIKILCKSNQALSASSSSSESGGRVIHEGSVGARPTVGARDFFTTIGAELRNTNRRIGCHILGDTSGVSYLEVESVLVDTRRRGGLGDMAGAAGEHESVIHPVLFGVQKVGAGTNCQRNQTTITKGICTHHSRQNLK